jgi:hypothetical protein
VAKLRAPRFAVPLRIAASFIAGAVLATWYTQQITQGARVAELRTARATIAEVSEKRPPRDERVANAARTLPFWSNQRAHLLAARSRELTDGRAR